MKDEGEEATHHGTELDHCAAGTGSTGQSKQRAGLGVGGSRRYCFAIYC